MQGIIGPLHKLKKYMKNITLWHWLFIGLAVTICYSIEYVRKKKAAATLAELRAAAERGDAKAQFGLGLRYAKGQGAPKDWTLAVQWYRKAADQGDAKAQEALRAERTLMARVWGRISPSHDAYQVIKKTIWMCCIGAVPLVAYVYFSAPPEAPQPPIAAADLAVFVKVRAAAEQGNAQAQLNLAEMYTRGQGVRHDEIQAVQWYHEAAKQGNAQAQYMMGFSYYTGTGITSVGALAADWYRKAADQGHIDAQVSLASMYANGEGVPKDDAIAVQWYRKAAEQGDTAGEENLGRMYANGRGVPQDKALAVQWYRKAAEQGSHYAPEALKALSGQ